MMQECSAENDSNSLLGMLGTVLMYPYCTKVDEQGNVVKHGLLRDVLGTTSPIADNRDVEANPSAVGTVVATKPEDGLFYLTILVPKVNLLAVHENTENRQQPIELAPEHADEIACRQAVKVGVLDLIVNGCLR